MAQVDRLILLDTYAAGEEPITGATGQDLYHQLGMKTNLDVTFVESISEVPALLDKILKPNDFVITQGAGETAQLATALTKKWMGRRIAK